MPKRRSPDNPTKKYITPAELLTAVNESKLAYCPGSLEKALEYFRSIKGADRVLASLRKLPGESQGAHRQRLRSRRVPPSEPTLLLADCDNDGSQRSVADIRWELSDAKRPAA